MMRGDYDYGVTGWEGEGFRIPPAYLQQGLFLVDMDLEEMEARAAEMNTDAETSHYGGTVPWFWQRHDHVVHVNWEQWGIHEDEITVRQEEAAAEEESGSPLKFQAAAAA